MVVSSHGKSIRVFETGCVQEDRRVRVAPIDKDAPDDAKLAVSFDDSAHMAVWQFAVAFSRPDANAVANIELIVGHAPKTDTPATSVGPAVIGCRRLSCDGLVIIRCDQDI
jgi:hypothetical protein